MLKTNSVMRRSQFIQQDKETIHDHWKHWLYHQKRVGYCRMATRANKNWLPYSTNLTSIYSPITVQLSGIIHQLRAGTLADFYCFENRGHQTARIPAS